LVGLARVVPLALSISVLPLVVFSLAVERGGAKGEEEGEGGGAVEEDKTRGAEEVVSA
jgi:hypothetical protein